MFKGFPDWPPIWFAGFCAAAWLLAREVPLVVAVGTGRGGSQRKQTEGK
jgi:hypothetical protein